MHPFRIDVPDAELLDLRERLLRTRLLPDSPRRPASGMTAAYLRELVDSWRSLDWRAREAWLNEHPQFIAELEDGDIHFVHLRRSGRTRPALLVMHGWPHTFALQLDFADLLPTSTWSSRACPGFAFSSPYATGEMTEKRLAATMHALMTRGAGL